MARATTSRYFVTTEVSNSKSHELFKAAIQTWAEKTGGEIIVLRSLYKLYQPTDGNGAGKEYDYTFDSDLDEYALKRQRRVGSIMLQGDVNIIPTAVKPLSGFGNYGKGLTCVFGHPKQHLESLPTVGANTQPQFLLTTGSVGDPKYNIGKAGKKAQFAEVIGGVIIEVSPRGTFFRQVHASKKTGSFCDLGFTFSDQGIKKEIVDAVIIGDTHTPFQDEPLYAEMFNNFLPAVVGKTKIKNCELILHDIIDGFTRNHHHKLNPILLAGMQSQSVETELQGALDFITSKRMSQYKSVNIVDSNHDRALDRWVNENDWRADPINSELMLWLAWSKIRATKIVHGEPRTVGALEIWLREQKAFKRAKINFIKDTKVVNGWELALHGDKGFNGARGSLESYSKIPTKTIIGHSHSTGMRDGTIQVGHTRTPAAYAAGGASSWAQSIAVVYRTGKAQLFVFDKNRKCCAPDTFKVYE